ncbi:hypothetical protein [Chlorobaculum parvum]|nr:hypothetical protein [Chlorobaculum parvum]
MMKGILSGILSGHNSRIRRVIGKPYNQFSQRVSIVLMDIYIDHNVWDFLFDRQIDLMKELATSEFALHLTREAEFEIPPTPDHKRRYIEQTIATCNIDVRPYFGFYDEQHSSSDQRVGGWGVGYWASEEEMKFIDSQQSRLGANKKRKTRLFKNEADISLAARSLQSVVLTLDKKAGPLQDAYRQGGKVVYLTDFDNSGLSLKDFIMSALKGTNS